MIKKNNYWTHTKLEKEKISNANLGHSVSEKTRQAVSKFRKGKSWEQSYGTKKARELRILKSEHMKGVGNSFFMKHHTQETRNLISQKIKDIWNTREYNFKILKEGNQIKQLGILLNEK